MCPCNNTFQLERWDTTGWGFSHDWSWSPNRSTPWLPYTLAGCNWTWLGSFSHMNGSRSPAPCRARLIIGTVVHVDIWLRGNIHPCMHSAPLLWWDGYILLHMYTEHASCPISVVLLGCSSHHNSTLADNVSESYVFSSTSKQSSRTDRC